MRPIIICAFVFIGTCANGDADDHDFGSGTVPIYAEVESTIHLDESDVVVQPLSEDFAVFSARCNESFPIQLGEHNTIL